MVAIAAESVTKRYYSKSGTVTALQDVSLEIGSGEFVSILGPSGCGKSTFLSIAAGLVGPTDGRMLANGEPIDGPQTHVGMVFQDALLLDWRDTLGNVMLQVEAKGLDPAHYRPRALELLGKVGLSGFEAKRPWELSGGMRQRVSICRALIHDPSVMLMDEPFGPLDALTREQLMLDLHHLWLESRKTVIFVTHSISEAVFLSDRVVVMTPRPGRIAEIVDPGMEHPRDLSVQGSEAFTRATGHIHEMFQSMGLFSERTTGPEIAKA
jgi:NitT/TauT family transport system ATP-binding protein